MEPICPSQPNVTALGNILRLTGEEGINVLTSYCPSSDMGKKKSRGQREKKSFLPLFTPSHKIAFDLRFLLAL